MSNSNGISIISLTADYLDDFATLMDKYRVFYGRNSNFDESKAYVSQLLGNDNVFFLLALTGEGKAIGFCSLFQSYSSVQARKVFILNDLYVNEDARKTGCGSQLLDSAMELAKSENVAFLKLETAEDNVTAQSVYDKNGWVLSGMLSYRLDVK